jgi:uncharacterized protein
MPRPLKERRVSRTLGGCVFRPAGKPVRSLQHVTLRCDEAESVRLADLEGLYQADAAGRMGVSRQTFGRIIESARRKIADAIINGKCLRIDGWRGNETGGLHGIAE